MLNPFIGSPDIFLTELKRNCSEDLIIFIVGAKADLQKHRQITHDLARLSLHNWFPPPRQPTPPPQPQPQPSTFSYMRPRFTSFTSIRSVPLSPPPLQKSSLSSSRDTDDSNDSRSSALTRSSTSPHYTRPRAKSGSLLQPSRIHENSIIRSNSRLESRFGYGATGYSPVADSNSNDHAEDEDDEDEGSQDSWGLSKGMELFEVSAKDDVGLYRITLFPFKCVIVQVIHMVLICASQAYHSYLDVSYQLL